MILKRHILECIPCGWGTARPEQPFCPICGGEVTNVGVTPVMKREKQAEIDMLNEIKRLSDALQAAEARADSLQEAYDKECVYTRGLLAEIDMLSDALQAAEVRADSIQDRADSLQEAYDKECVYTRGLLRENEKVRARLEAELKDCREERDQAQEDYQDLYDATEKAVGILKPHV